MAFLTNLVLAFHHCVEHFATGSCLWQIVLETTELIGSTIEWHHAGSNHGVYLSRLATNASNAVDAIMCTAIRKYRPTTHHAPR